MLNVTPFRMDRAYNMVYKKPYYNGPIFKYDLTLPAGGQQDVYLNADRIKAIIRGEDVVTDGTFANVTEGSELLSNLKAATLGSNLISSQNDRDFSSGNIGNWTVNKDGSGTCTYDSSSQGGVDDKQGLLTANGDTYLYASLGSAQLSSLSDGDKILFGVKVKVPAANVQKTVVINTNSFDSATNRTYTKTLTADTWTLLLICIEVGSDTVGQFRVGFSSSDSPANGDEIYFDDIYIGIIDSDTFTEGDGWYLNLESGETDSISNWNFDNRTATNDYTSDFSVGTDGFGSIAGTSTGNIDGIDGQDDNLRFTTNADNAAHGTRHITKFISGNYYRLRYSYYIPSGQSNIDGVRPHDGNNFITSIGSTTDTWTDVDVYFTASDVELRFYAYDGASQVFQDAGGDDVFYIKDVIIDEITLDDFTVSGTRSATNYPEYQSDNQVRLVSDGNNLGIQQAVSSSTDYYYEFDNAAVVSGGAKLSEYNGTAINDIIGTDKSSTGIKRGIFTTASDTTHIILRRTTACDITVNSFRIFELSKLNMRCDGSGTEHSYLETNWGLEVGKLYKTVLTLDSYTSGAFQSNINSVSSIQIVSATTLASYLSPSTSANPNRVVRSVNGVGVGEISLDDLSIKQETITDWTSGAGITPSTDGTSLTNKAQFTASSGDLTEAGILTNGDKYEIIYTITRSGGSVTPKAGSVAGTARSVAGTYIDEITSDGTDLTFTGASFTGTVDLVSARSISESVPQNSLIFRIDRATVKCYLIKVISGAYTVLLEESITYGNDKTWIGLRDPDTNKVWIFYDGDQVGEEQQVTDTEIINNKRHFRNADDGSGDFDIRRLSKKDTEDSGTLTADILHQIITTEVDHFFTNCAIGDYFVSVGTETLDANNTTKEVRMP